MVDLLPRRPPHVADPHVVRARLDREPEWISEAERDDAPHVRVRAQRIRVVGETLARLWVDPDHGPVEEHGLASGTSCALCAQRTALGGRRRQIRSTGPRRVAAAVPRLAPVGVVEAGAVPAARVERAVDAEEERADRVARELLAPTLHEDVLL